MNLSEARTPVRPAQVDLAENSGLNIERPVRLILYHGRFQPPHKGHIAVIRHFLAKYREARVIISIDSRPPDERNPFSVEHRRRLFGQYLSGHIHRVIITSHRCLSPTFEGCLPPTYENARRFGAVDLVIGGPDLAPEAREFWRGNRIAVEALDRRLFNISGTQVRAALSAATAPPPVQTKETPA